ncbi:MAG TPA: nucleotide exchange factor GrpE [Candidatus Dormibacteraeota bacterium]|nr:nucleotide exchange factor GrpE [Candidatus Dormibacteraeota bacterium]
MSKNDSKKKSNSEPMFGESDQQIAILTEALQRERADSLNLRRRHEQEMSNLKNYVKTDIINDLLPIIDNFERSVKHIPEKLKNDDYIMGIKSILKQFEKVIKDLGVEKIETVGHQFNPAYHEAISMEDGDGDGEIVVEELQSGYRIGDHVIRHSIVKVKPGFLDKPEIKVNKGDK